MANGIATDTMERGTEASEAAASGLWAPAVTPLDEALMPDHARFVAHVKWLLDNGCHGVTVFGTTGEATSFSVDERIALLESLLRAGVPAERLMVGNGCCALSDTLRLTGAALDRGCGKVLMLPPFYYKDVSDQGLYASYSEVIERVGDTRLRVFLYHFPRLSTVPITHTVIERLRKNYGATIAGLKDSTGDEASTRAYIAAFPDLAIFPGTETLMLPMLQEGGAGCITASANVNATAIRALYDAWQGGDESAGERQAKITAVRQVLQAKPMIPGLKSVIAGQRQDPGWRRVRPPLVALSEADAVEHSAALAAVGFVFGKA